MAQFTAGITTDATGSLQLAFTMPEERAQDIFAMFLGTAAPVTEVNPDTGETTTRTRKLGECLRDKLTAFILSIEQEAIDYKKRVAAQTAAAAITDTSEVQPVVSP